MLVTSIFSSPKPSPFFSFLSSKEDAYVNRVHEVAYWILLTCYETIAKILAMAALIYLWQGSVTFDAAVTASAALIITSNILARAFVSWNLW